MSTPAWMQKTLDLRSKFWFRVHGDEFMMNGLPDFAVVGPGGIFMGLELKLGKDRVSPLQLWRLQQIRAAGGVGKVIRTEEDLLDAFRRAEALSRSNPSATR